MHRILSYVIKRYGINMWLVQGEEPLPTDEVLYTRCMLVADDGKVLVKDGVIVGGCIVLKDPNDKDKYEEIDIPQDENEEDQSIYSF